MSTHDLVVELLTRQAEKLGGVLAELKDLRGDFSAHAKTDQASFKELRVALSKLETGYAIAQSAGAQAGKAAGASVGKTAGIIWGAGGATVVVALLELVGKIIQ